MRLKCGLVLMVLAVGCGPDLPCARGHEETVHVPAETTMESIDVGEVTVWYPQYTPAYDYVRFVCDEYAVERPVNGMAQRH